MAVFTGNATATNGSATVTVSGIVLAPISIFPGATVSIGGQAYFLLAIVNTTTLTLTRNYTGTTGTFPVEINTISDNESDIVTLNTRTADLIEDLLEFDPLNNLASISDLTGNGVILQDATGAHSLVPKADLTNGVDVDGKAETIASRNSLYGAQTAGFTVLVADVGDGRSAVYFKQSNTLNDWSTPAYFTGPASTVPGPAGVNWRNDYSAGTAYVLNDGVTFNGSSFRKLNSSAAGNAPSSSIPPVNNANWEVIAARGVNGSITGVTPFWNGRITVDVDAGAARAGLGALGVGDFGLGSTNIAVETDLNNPSSATRFSRWGNTTLNRPEDFGSAIQIERAAGFFSQLGIGANGPVYSRTFQTGVSAAWRTLWDSVSLPTITQAQAEAGALTSAFAWSPERVRQAILALAPAGANVRTALSGSANAIVLTSTVALVVGLEVRFRATAVNTGATTIAYAGGAAVACRTISGAVLPAGYIRTDVDTVATYDGTNWILDREIERGSNANGFYTRFADGTQLCGRETFSVAASVTTVPWPVAFASAVYTCGGTPISSFGTSITSVKFSSFTTTNAQVILTNAATGSSTIAPVAANICFFAQGYWY